MRTEARAMLRIAKIMDALEPDAQRRVAFDVHRTYGGPLTGAQRQAMHRERTRNEPVTTSNGLVTGESNEGVTNARYLVGPRVYSSSSSSVREEKKLLREESTEVLAFLNKKTNRSYRFTDTNLGFIEGRLKDGATVQDCKSVIARQVREWLSDPKMTKYLRPETLFNKTKFESYVGMAAPENV